MRFPSSLHFVAGVVCAALSWGTVLAEEPPDPEPGPAADEERLAQARDLVKQGKSSEARDALVALVKEEEARLGPQNPQTLSTRLELAIVESDVGESLKAEHEMRSLVALLSRRRGAEHEETLRCRAALARLLDDAGRPSEAAEEYRQLLACREHVLGPNDVEVASACHALGDALVSGQKYGEAIPQFERAEAIFESTLGPEDPVTLLNRSNLAMARAENRDYATAERELRALLAIREKRLGPKDVSVFVTCFELGRTLGGERRLEEALSYATRAEGGFRGTLGERHQMTAQAAGLAAELRADIQRLKKGKAPETE
jgi:tetratricopeptide (TPR) repeat protein